MVPASNQPECAASNQPECAASNQPEYAVTGKSDAEQDILDMVMIAHDEELQTSLRDEGVCYVVARFTATRLSLLSWLKDHNYIIETQVITKHCIIS